MKAEFFVLWCRAGQNLHPDLIDKFGVDIIILTSKPEAKNREIVSLCHIQAAIEQMVSNLVLEKHSELRVVGCRSQLLSKVETPSRRSGP